MASILHILAAIVDGGSKLINYQIIEGNEVWRFGVVLAVILAGMIFGKILQFLIVRYVKNYEEKAGVNIVTLLLKCISKPVSIAVFALSLYLCMLCLVFENSTAVPPTKGISMMVASAWLNISKAVAAIAVAYAIYRLVDIAEYYLLQLTSKTQTKLDDMLVPAARKALRITIAIISAIYIVDNVLQQDIKSILVGAGIGGIAIALAAKETVAKFFGSITIFVDRPFQIDEVVKIGEYTGSVEEVGFRSTRIRTVDGHVVAIPNDLVANATIENISKRPCIRREANITITYESKHTKAQRVVEIIKEILSKVPEVNSDEKNTPRVYFSDFKDWSLNIYMVYWVRPADYWLFQEVNQRVNIEIMKRFDAEGIEFAFPSQTVYLKKEANA